MELFNSETEKEEAVKRLQIAIKGFCILSLHASPSEIRFGHPCSRLITEAIHYGAKGLAEFLLNHQGSSGEYRLNGAGLKLFWHMSIEPVGENHLVLRIGGDQMSNYPQTVPEFKKLIRENRWDYEGY